MPVDHPSQYHSVTAELGGVAMAGWPRRMPGPGAVSPTTAPPFSPAQILELLQRVRTGVSDLAETRDRVVQQMKSLAEQVARLTSQAQEAKRAGREDLAQVAERRAAQTQAMYQQLDVNFRALDVEHQKLVAAAKRLEARVAGVIPASAPAGLYADAPVGERNTRTIPQDVKIRVIARDGGRCRQCGSTSELHYAYVIPWSMGGANTVQNIQLLCGRCNRRKGANGIQVEGLTGVSTVANLCTSRVPQVGWHIRYVLIGVGGLTCASEVSILLRRTRSCAGMRAEDDC